MDTTVATMALIMSLLFGIACSSGGTSQDVVFDGSNDFSVGDSEVGCIPDCQGFQCGDDGCGGSCGNCPKDKVCMYGFCLDKFSCSDGKMNGTESDVDCGGICGACALGKDCNFDYDCQSGLCKAGTCTNPANCTNGKQDGTETDEDCGGNCPPCEVGRKCEDGADCISGLCSSGLCEECSAECTDKECGFDGCGGSCGTCGTDKFCNDNHLCEAGEGYCFNGADKAIIEADPDKAVKMTVACIQLLCFADEKCTVDCLVDGTEMVTPPIEGLGVSKSCAGCYAEAGLCGFKGCIDSCSIDPDSAGCLGCVVEKCLDDLVDCTGLVVER